MSFSELLITNGYKFKESNVTGNLKNCYEKFISLSDLYDGYCAVELESGNGYIYIEFECGGEVASYNFNIYEFNPEAKDNPEEAYEELEDYIDTYISSYKEENNYE